MIIGNQSRSLSLIHLGFSFAKKHPRYHDNDRE